MRKRNLTMVASCITAVMLIVSCSEQKNEDELWKEAVKITNEVVAIDAHAHPMVAALADRNKFDLGIKQEISHVDFLTMKEGGLDALFLVATIPGELERVKTVEKILNDNLLFHQQLNKYSDIASLASAPDDIINNSKEGRRSLLLSVEYPGWLKSDISNLQKYYDKGIRMITLVHDSNDPLADINDEDNSYVGLSEYGKQVVREMNKLGMIIDITHCADSLQLDIIKCSEVPVIASHSCARSVVDIKRNIPDPILVEVAAKGGVVCPTFYSGFVSNRFREELSKANDIIEKGEKILVEKYGKDSDEYNSKLEELENKLQPEKATLEEYVDHIDHIVKTVGINHVGIGSDFIGPKERTLIRDAAEWPSITFHLLKRGYSKEGISKILGGNILRLMKSIELIKSD